MALTVSGCLAFMGAAKAQLQLPGASAATPAGATTKPATAAKPKPKTPAAPAPARGEESLPGKTLTYMGQAGKLVFQRSAAKGFVLSLATVGRRGNDIRNACNHDFTPLGDAVLTAAGRPNGLPRYEATLGGCAMAFEFLGDAAMATMPGGACTIGDCAVDISGLWGPALAELPKEADIERARGGAERRLNAARKVLQQRYKSGPDARSFISDQVSFPANRERMCRAYGSVQGQGFCALKLTEARASQLEATAYGHAPRAEKADKPAKPQKAAKTTP